MSRRRKSNGYRVWLNERVYVEPKLIPAHMIELDPDYQRRIEMDRVNQMVEEFNPLVVNPLKVSHREGKYYAFDGGHTLMMEKKVNEAKATFLVECRVYENLTKDEEKILFAAQTGLSKPISVNDRLNALAGANDPKTVDLIRATNAAGVNLAIREKKGTYLGAVRKAVSVYDKYGSEIYEEALSLIMKTWKGRKDSLLSNILGGTATFLNAFGKVYDQNRFITKLKGVEPKELLTAARRNKTDYQSLDAACATEIAKAYNKGRGKGALGSFVVV